MKDRQGLWPYVLALISALLAPTALRHALEEEPKIQIPPSPAQIQSPAQATTIKPEAWDQFVCSYFYPKQATGYCPDPKRLDLPLSVEYLIAGVPDPESTSIPATFDVMLEALMSAAAAENWAYDRNWLPWGSTKPDEKKASSPESPALTDDRPGMLLFRKTDRLLLIFLVGETPTSGVSKTALFNAARFIYARSAEPVELKILGPRFSGSVPSYRRALEGLLSDPKYGGVHFVTGSATREDNHADLKSLALSGRPFRYEGTVEHDARTQRLFLDWLATRGVAPHEVAILSEGGTAFGATFREAAGVGESLKLEFPYQISRLRNAYEKDPELRAIWMGAPARNGKVQWSVRSDREGTDRPRTFQGPQATVVQERQLDALVQAIQHHKIRAAAINATDILDTVFLTLLLRRQCPDVRLFTMDSDLLFTYASGSLSFNGLLMVSPYPLWLESHSHYLPASPSHLHTFANRSAEGVYNAFMRLTEGTNYRDYWSPAGEDRPPLWVTTIGLGQVVPLAILGSGEQDAASQLVNAGQQRTLTPWLLRPDAAYGLLFLLFAGLVGYGAYVYVSRRVAEHGQGRPQFNPAFHFLFEPPDPGVERTFYVQIMCAFGFVAVLPFTVWGGWPLCAVLAAIFLFDTAREPKRWQAVPVGCALVALVALLTIYWIRVQQAGLDARWEAFFFRYRLLHPASGVSPLPAWVLAWFGCAWWAVAKMNQVRTRELRSPRLWSWPAGEPMLGSLDRVARTSYELAESVVTLRSAAAQVLGLALICWSMAGSFGSLEPETPLLKWTQGVFFAILLLSFLVLMSVTQVFQIHSSVMKLLNALLDHPLGDAFERLPKDLAASKLWLRGGNRSPLQSCLQSLRRLRELAQANFPGAPGFVEMFRLESTLGELLETGSDGRRAKTEKVAELHVAFNRIANQLYPVVAAGWQSKPLLPQHNIAEEFVALRLAALLRYLVMQMRATIEYISLALVALILAVISYPLAPQHGLVNTVAALVGLSGVTVVYVIAKLDRHPVMQKFASTNSTSFLDTFRKVAGFGLAPLVATFTALFPGSVRNLGTLIEAASRYLGAK